MTRWVALLLVVLTACAEDPTTPAGGPAEPAACPGGVEAAAWTAPRQVAVTGPSVNALHVVGDQILMVVSQDNTIMAYDPETQAIRRFADLGNDRGPYDLAWNDTHIFVTNFVSESVSVFDRTGHLVAELTDGFAGPSGVAVGEGVVYVSNVDYLSPTQGYGDGYVAVIDADDFTTLGTIPTAHKNPQFLRYDQGALFVSDTGALDFVDGRAVATTSGALERWSFAANPLQPTVEVAELPVDSPTAGASPGRPVIVGSSAYVASATAPHVYALDLTTFVWRRGLDNPIVLYASSADALHHMATDGSILYVSAFNRDDLWRIDPSCDAVLGSPIPVGSSDLLEGAHDLVAVPGSHGTNIFVALNLANSLTQLTIENAP
ncbi:MAG: hypothetical protein R3E66_02610 [bacterium]